MQLMAEAGVPDFVPKHKSRPENCQFFMRRQSQKTLTMFSQGLMLSEPVYGCICISIFDLWDVLSRL